MTDDELRQLGWEVRRSDAGLRIERCGVVLWCGDCFLVAAEIQSVDVTITDPPYSEVIHKGARTRNQDEVLINFDSITDEQFMEICAACVEKSLRWVVLTCDWRHAYRLEQLESLVRLGVWIKPNGAPQFTGDRPGTGWEPVAVLHRKGRKRWNGGGHHAVWTFNKTEGVHRTQKPLPLIQKWVIQFTDPGELVFDPFMGSATTGVACIQLGRRFVGIEKNPEFFDDAVRRVNAAINERLTQRSFLDDGPQAIPRDAQKLFV